MIALEYGQYGIAYASCCGAMTSIMHLVKSGEHVIVHDRVYAGIQRYFKNFSVLKYNVNI